MKDVTNTNYLEWTKADFIFHHRKMWNWIADETLRLKRIVNKYEYFRAMNIDEVLLPLNKCYCCESCCHLKYCDNCPIDWKSNAPEFKCQNKEKRLDNKGIYGKWLYEFDYKKSAKLARTIANLPEKE